MNGQVVLVTRPADRNASLIESLRAAGARPVAAPAIVIAEPADGGPLDGAVREAGRGAYAWVVFTSAAGVRAWWRRAAVLGSPPPAASVAVVGDATADAVREHGVEPALVPGSFTTVALGAAFPPAPPGGGSVLLARADLATSELESRIAEGGWSVERVDAYAVRGADDLPTEARDALVGGRVDAVLFTSPSTVEGFLALAAVPERAKVVCIGPVTAEAASARGLAVAAVADPHTEEGLVRAVRSVFE